MNSKYVKKYTVIVLILLGIFGCTNQNKLKPGEAKQIAEEAYIFAYPMLENYKVMFAQAMYDKSGAYVAPFNVLFNKTTLEGPKDTIIVRPNNDTFYGGAWLDLSAQPQILKVPAITDGRYYSFQIIDMYTHNIDYIGSRKTGNGAGIYMFVGPDWKGEVPKGINKVIQSEGNYLVALGRTQVFGPDDVDMAQAVTNGYKLESLSQYLGQDVPKTASPLLNLPPFNPQKISNENFIGYFNALMAYGKIHPSETELFQKFAKIGIEPGKPFNPEDFDPEIIEAINDGIKSGMEKIKEKASKLGERKNGWQLLDKVFGPREVMQGKYLTRAAAAYFGFWGNDLEEAYYPECTADSDGEALDGSKYNYVLHFDKDRLPPVNAFWSFTMYKLPQQLFIENPINRYVISSATKGLKYDQDGSLDIYIQKDSPGKDKASNWLPAYDGPFSLQGRMYWPKPEALNPLYVPPAVQRVK
jgi:hypothetical protein